MKLLTAAIIFITGLFVGSFLNVCIYRMPKGLSPLRGRSKCPHCGSNIRWFDNIPLVSFAVLRGRCRECGDPISWRYPLVELLTAFLFLAVYFWNHKLVTGELFIGLVLVCTLIAAAFTDLDAGIIPNRLLLPAGVAELVLVVATALYRSQPGRIGTAFVGAAVGGGLMFTCGIGYGYLVLRRRGSDTGNQKDSGAEDRNIGGGNDEAQSGEKGREIPTAIGMGDVKLVAFMGLALGYFAWYNVLVAIFIGVLMGALMSIMLMIAKVKGLKDKIRFAPYLSAGALIALFWGQALVERYLNLFR